MGKGSYEQNETKDKHLSWNCKFYYKTKNSNLYFTEKLVKTLKCQNFVVHVIGEYSELCFLPVTRTVLDFCPANPVYERRLLLQFLDRREAVSGMVQALFQ